MVTWLGSYVYWHILHPHLKNYIKELSFYWQTLNSPEADNHLISTFCTYTNCLGLIDVLSANDRAEIAGCILLAWKPFWTYQYCQKDELWKVKSLPALYSCSPKKVPLYGQAYPYRPCIGSTSRACQLRETEARIVLFSYCQRILCTVQLVFTRAELLKA